MTQQTRAEALKALQELNARVREATKDIKNVIVVMSGKGGVGKSIVAASLSIALSKLGKRVAALDADIHGPSIPWLMGVENERMMADDDGRILPVDAEGVKVVSVELALDRKDLPLIWRGPLKTRAVIDLLSLVKWGNIDYLVVDLPPGTGDEPQTVVRYLKNKVLGAILVMIPGNMVSHIVRKAKNFASILGIKVIGAVINMAYFRCPHCGKTTDIFGKGNTVDVEVLARLPLEPRVAELADGGMLTKLFDDDEDELCEWARGILEVATKIIDLSGGMAQR